jgi:hypothetical protein
LRLIRAEETRLIDAVKQGQELNALVAALQKTQERRETLERQVAMLSSTAIDRLPDPGRLRACLMKQAAEVRRVLTRREPDVRRVLQAAITERLEFAPFNDGAERGYQFSGPGSYGEVLLGDTCPTSNGGPNGTRSNLHNSSPRFDCALALRCPPGRPRSRPDSTPSPTTTPT